ncbi:hypothetical protein GCM10022252_76480 [Streptosporangium oxazolinicum]|uniref:DUF6545 domain-containing protein n=1 Tax=Streptosporangium oxazolinicum TaxID=909287 RepID=A0ABP8BLE3_9ACTN
MTGWLITAALWAAVAVRLRQRATRQDQGLLLMFTGIAVGFTLARPEVAALVDAGEVTLSSLLKRCTAMIGAVGVALYMSGVAGRRGRVHIIATITVIICLIITYFAGADRWGETNVFFADQSRFTLNSGEVWAGWAHFLLWYLYVAFVVLALAATCASAAAQTSGVLRVQLVLFGAGAVWCALSPVYALAGLAGLTVYDLGFDQTFLLIPSVLLLIAGMAWQALHRGVTAAYAWWLYTRLGGLWRLLAGLEPGVVLEVGGPWRLRLHRRVVECHDVLRQLAAYLPEGTYESGRVDAGAAALQLREALTVRQTGAPGGGLVPGAPVEGGNDVQEAQWLIRLWRAWKRLGPVRVPA